MTNDLASARRGLLIFDLDGTLFRTEICSVAALKSVFREQSLPPPATEEWVRLFGRPDEDFVAWLSSQAGPGLGAALLAEIAARELAMVPSQGKLYPGARDALVALRPRVEQMAVCSNGPAPYVRTVVRAMGLEGLLEAVRWRQRDDRGKADMVRDLLALLSARPAILIGDRREDVEAAHASGIVAIGARYGYGGPGELEGADALIDSVLELPAAVAKLRGMGP